MLEKLLAEILIIIVPLGTSMIRYEDGITHTCGQNLAGFYIIGTNQISICKGNEQDKGLINHEIGHYVYYSKLTEKQRKVWEVIYGQGHSEGFADLFSDRVVLGFNIWFPEDKEIVKKFMKKVFEKFIN